MPRDALWVLPSGVTTVVTLDDDGNLIEDVAETVETVTVVVPKSPVAFAEGTVVTIDIDAQGAVTGGFKEPPKPDPPPQQHRHRGRRNRR